MDNRAIADMRRKLKVLNANKEIKNVSKTCRLFGISRDTYYQWKKAYEDGGEAGLINSKPCPENPKIRVPQLIEEKILYLPNLPFGPTTNQLVFSTLS